MKNWNVRQEDIDAYLKVCRDAVEDDEVFAVFKSLPAYRKILEHASRSLGAKYYYQIEQNNKDLLLNYPGFWENDLYGKPYKSNWLFPIGEITCSPTTLQYIGVLSNLIKEFGSLDGFTIAEIGGGYGGQCKVIYDYCRPKEYTIIDLEEPGMLQDKYLSKFKISANIVSQLYAERGRPCDLVISNYALSEIVEPFQTNYVRAVLLFAKYGYITCNGPIHAMQEIKDKFPTFKISPDIEGERKENFIITW